MRADSGGIHGCHVVRAPARSPTRADNLSTPARGFRPRRSCLPVFEPGIPSTFEPGGSRENPMRTSTAVFVLAALVLVAACNTSQPRPAPVRSYGPEAGAPQAMSSTDPRVDDSNSTGS